MLKRTKYVTKLHRLTNQTKVVTLLGARQVGKTTLMKQFQEELQGPTLYINCEDFFTRPFESLAEMKEWIRNEYGFDIQKSGHLFLDEIQVWEDPDRLIKSYYDNDDIGAHLIVTGSRFRGQMTLGSSMVGRGKTMHVSGYTFEEYLTVHKPHMKLTGSVSRSYIEPLLTDYLTWGQYPAVVHALTRQEKIDTIESIFRTWIDKDFRYYSDTTYQGDFVKILQWISLQTGNFAKIQTLTQEFSLKKKVVQQMIQFLIDSFVAHRVSPYFSDKSKEYNHAVSLYIHDTGLLNYLRGDFRSVVGDGKVTETFVARQLADLREHGRIYYYKKKNGSEIDFVFETGLGDIIPLEVKSKNVTHIPKAFHGFYENYQHRILALLVTGREQGTQLSQQDLAVDRIPYWYVREWVGGVLEEGSV